MSSPSKDPIQAARDLVTLNRPIHHDDLFDAGEGSGRVSLWPFIMFVDAEMAPSLSGIDLTEINIRLGAKLFVAMWDLYHLDDDSESPHARKEFIDRFAKAETAEIGRADYHRAVEAIQSTIIACSLWPRYIDPKDDDTLGSDPKRLSFQLKRLCQLFLEEIRKAQ